MPKFKTISSIGLVGFLGLIVYLFWQLDKLKDDKADQLRETTRLEWLLEAKEKENDVLRDFGEYSIPDTVWDSIPVPYLVHDTLPPDTFYARIPRIWGYFEIDTVVGLGLSANPLYVRVEGRVYHPKEYESRNWLKVYQDSLDIWELPPLPPSSPKIRSYALGLGMAFKTSQGAHIGLNGRFKRISLGVFYNPWQKSLISGISIELVTF